MEQEPAQAPPSRWEVELEFVQSLANPMYVHYLAQNKYLDSPEFLAYLDYLEYWRKPENAKFLAYPNCLHILKLLHQPLFRQEVAKVDLAKAIMDEFWRKWVDPTTQAPQSPQPPPEPQVKIENETPE